MTTGERMKHRRKELGFSAEYVAEKLGVSPATIYRYEKGDIEKMPGNILEPISKILATTPSYLMGWDVPPAPAHARGLPVLSGDELELVEKYRQLTEFNRGRAIQQIDTLLESQNEGEGKSTSFVG